MNLSTGTHIHLQWPSILHFGYRVFPEPHGSLVAVEFGDPVYANSQTYGYSTRAPTLLRTSPDSRS